MLHATSHEGVIRMEYFDSDACEIGSLGKRTIPLRDCSGIKQSVGNKTQPYVFELQSQIGNIYHLGFNTIIPTIFYVVYTKTKIIATSTYPL